MRRLLAITIAVIGLTRSPGQESMLVGLDDCVEIAFRNQPALRVQREKTHIAQEHVDVAKSNYYPHVTAGARFTAIDEPRSFDIDGVFSGPVEDVFTDAAAFFQIARGFGSADALNGLNNPSAPIQGGPSFDQFKELAANSLPNSIRVNVLGEAFVNTQIQLVQPIWTAGRIKYRVDQSHCAVELAALNERRIRQQLRFNVTRAYLSVLLSRHLLNVAIEATEDADSLEHFLDQMSSKLGSPVNEPDVELVRAAHQLLKAQNPRFQAAERRAIASLQLAMGVSPYSSIAVQADSLSFSNLAIHEEEVISTALANRPEVHQASIGMRVVALARRTARAEFMPEVVGFARMASIHDDRGFANPNDSVEWAGGVAASLTLTNGGRRSAQVRIANHEMVLAKARLAQIRQKVVQEAKNAFIALEEARAAAGINDRARLSAKAAFDKVFYVDYEDTREPFKIHLASIMMRAKAAAQYYESLFAYNLAISQLSLATGVSYEVSHYKSLPDRDTDIGSGQ